MVLQEIIYFYVPIIASILTIVTLLINLVGPLLSIRKRTRQDINRLDAITDEDVKGSYNLSKYIVNINYRRLERFYENTRNQNNSWFIFSVILFSVGILVMIVALALPSYVYLNIQIIVLMSGAFLDVIAIAFFLRTRQASQEIDRYCSEKFLEGQKLSQLIKLVSENPNLEVRNRLKERIIMQILLPSRERENSVDNQTVQYNS